MRSNYIHSIAVYMIVLIISLPFYSSAVFASLSNPTVKGEDNIEGYVREIDSVTISVDAKIGNTNIRPSQVHENNINGMIFDNCIQQLNGAYECTYQTDTSSFSINPFSFRIALYDENNILDSITYANGAKDTSPPKITEFTSSQEIVGEGDVRFNYRIEESIDGQNTNKCVGIKEMIVKYDAGSRTIPINSQQDNCIYEDSFSENINTITTIDSGNVTIEAIAYDYFDQPSAPITTTITVDKIGPEIDESSFRLFDSNNNDIEFVSEPITVSAFIRTRDQDVDKASADFSSLGPYNGIIRAHCNNQECSWENIKIDLNTSGNRQITINITDMLGNNRITILDYNFKYDDSSPEGSLIKTNYLDTEGNSYLGKNDDNQIIVEIDEQGVGFNKKNIYLDLRNIDKGENVQADNCTKENLWRCYWNIGSVSVSDGIRDINIRANSADDLGNAITGTLIQQIIVDTTDPVINEISYTPENPVSGDILELAFNVQDLNPVIPKASTPRISTTPLHEGICDNGCTIDIEDLISSYTQSRVQVTAEDAAGNLAVKEKLVTIYHSDENSTPSFYGIRDIELIPSRIDKKIASQIPVNVYVHVKLQGHGSGLITAKTIDCTEMAGYLEESPHLMNEYEDDPYIVIKTNQAAGSLEGNLPIKCKLRLSVRDDQNVYGTHEEEIIDEEVELYGNALGDIGEAVEEKLKKIDADIKDVNDEIEKYEKWIDTMGMWCSIAQSMIQINTVIQNIKSVLYSFKASAAAAAMAACKTPSIGCAGVCGTPAYGKAVAAYMNSPPAAFNSILITAAPGPQEALTATGVAAACSTAAGACLGLCPQLNACVIAMDAALVSCGKWITLQASWLKTCLWGNWFHSMVENIFWPSGYIHPNVIGMISKYGCMILFNCVIADAGSVVIDLAGRYIQGYVGRETKAKAMENMENKMDAAVTQAKLEVVNKIYAKTGINAELDDNFRMTKGAFLTEKGEVINFEVGQIKRKADGSITSEITSITREPPKAKKIQVGGKTILVTRNNQIWYEKRQVGTFDPDSGHMEFNDQDFKAIKYDCCATVNNADWVDVSPKEIGWEPYEGGGYGELSTRQIIDKKVVYIRLPKEQKSKLKDQIPDGTIGKGTNDKYYKFDASANWPEDSWVETTEPEATEPKLSKRQQEDYKKQITDKYSSYQKEIQASIATQDTKEVTPQHFETGTRYNSKEDAIKAVKKVGFKEVYTDDKKRTSLVKYGDKEEIEDAIIINDKGIIAASSTEPPTPTPTTEKKTEKKTIRKKLSDWVTGTGTPIEESKAYLQKATLKSKDSADKKSLYDYTSWIPAPKLGERQESVWYRDRYTDLPTSPPMDGETWLWNPYESIHYAKFSMCIPGLVYNYKKDKQLKCLYRNCVRNHLNAGMSITNCELAYKERECLYVTSAQFKKYGMGGIFDKLVDIAIQKLPYIIVGSVFAKFCANYVITGASDECMEEYVVGIAAAGFHPVICGIKGTINTVLEITTIMGNGLGGNNHEQDLGGEDYCATGNSLV